MRSITLEWTVRLDDERLAMSQLEEQSLIDRIIDIARGAEAVVEDERENREFKRRPYDGWIALVQLMSTGGRTRPLTIQGKDISVGGVGVVSRQMLHVGHKGAVLFRRSNGEPVLVGGEVVHCNYVGQMRHESGIAFIDLPDGIVLDDFRDERGELPQLAGDLAA